MNPALTWGAAAVQHHGTLFSASSHSTAVMISDKSPMEQSELDANIAKTLHLKPAHVHSAS